LNIPLEEFQKTVVRKNIKSVESRGKWLFIKLDSHILLFNPGMGADVIHFKSDDKLPKKYQIKITLNDKTGFTIRVWWFCYLHLMPEDKIGEHKLTAKLGITPLDKKFTLDHFNRQRIRTGHTFQCKNTPQKKDPITHQHGNRCPSQVYQISAKRKH